jgi:hypothetical protein
MKVSDLKDVEGRDVDSFYQDKYFCLFLADFRGLNTSFCSFLVMGNMGY